MEIKIKSVDVGKTQENCYLLFCKNESYIIDPGDDYLKIMEVLELDKFKIKGIINTHGHYDHIGAVSDLKRRCNIPFFIHSADKKIVSRGNLYKRVTGDLGNFKTPSIDGYLDDMSPLFLGDKKIHIHHIPGHTQGCVCFEFEDSLIIGDTILEYSIGRTDLPGGSSDQMSISLEYIFSNFINYTIYPGHGSPFILTTKKIQELNLNR